MAARCGCVMTPAERIDLFLAAAFRREHPPWPSDWNADDERERFLERVDYHGIGVLLLDRTMNWPGAVREALKAQAISQAVWELKHRRLLERLIDAMAAREARPLFLKGTALAYSVYDEPAQRDRADTDLLVQPRDVAQARLALQECGLSRNAASADGELQEVWRLDADGVSHVIDLHFAAFNTPYLDQILPVEECFARAVPLPKLHAQAAMLSPAYCLLHTAIHRNLHRTAPYFSGSTVNFGADRLIWAIDIALLGSQFDDAEWDNLVRLAEAKAVVRATGEALRFSQTTAAAVIPAEVLDRLSIADSAEPRSEYLLDAGRRSRALTNFLATGDWKAQIRRLRAIASPSDRALRMRYPEWPKAPRVLLLARRLFDFALNSRR